MLTYIEQCIKGIHGVVHDASTYQTIEGVTITVKNHDALGSSVTSHAVGDFHRPIKGGSYTIEFSKDGYETKTVDVTIANGQRIDLEVYLVPVGAGVMGEQTVSLREGWNWWSTCLNTTAEYLQSVLGDGVTIVSQDGSQPQIIAPSTMYMIHVDEQMSANIVGILAEPSAQTITLNPGVNWIGYPCTENLPIATALGNVGHLLGWRMARYTHHLATGEGLYLPIESRRHQDFCFPFQQLTN